MSSDGTETAPAKTTTMNVDREFYHLPCRDRTLFVIPRVRCIVEREIIYGICLGFCCRRKCRVDHHRHITALLSQPDGVHAVARLLKQDKVFSVGFPGCGCLMTWSQGPVPGTGIRRNRNPCRYQVRRLGHIPDILQVLPGLQPSGQSCYHPLRHPVDKHVCSAGNQNGRLKLVLPVIIMHQSPHGGLYPPYEYRQRRKKPFKRPGVDYCCIIRSEAGSTAGSIGIIGSQPAGCSIMVDHGVHVSCSNSKEKTGLPQLGEVAQIIPPVGLRNNGYLHPFRLQNPCNYRSPERRVINVGITRKQNDISPPPPKSVHLLPRCGEPVQPVFFTPDHVAKLHIMDKLL